MGHATFIRTMQVLRHHGAACTEAPAADTQQCLQDGQAWQAKGMCWPGQTLVAKPPLPTCTGQTLPAGAAVCRYGSGLLWLTTQKAALNVQCHMLEPACVKHAHTSSAACLWGDETAMMTLASQTLTVPILCAMATCDTCQRCCTAKHSS